MLLYLNYKNIFLASFHFFILTLLYWFCIHWGFPCGSAGKESACNARDLGSVPALGRSPGEGDDNPTPVFLPGKSHGQRSLADYSWWGYKSQTQISNYKTTTKMSLKLSLSSTILWFCGLALNTIFSSDMHTICEGSVYMASLDK